MKRRPKGTGAIYETGDKRKEFRYRGELIIGKKESGEKIRKTFRGATQADVDAQMRKFKKAGNEKVVLFSEALDNMLEFKVKQKKVKDKTKILVEGLINNHLGPSFGNFTLEKLTPEYCKNQFNKWENKFSYSMRKKLLQNARLAFDLAKRNYNITINNPFDGIVIHNENRNKPKGTHYFTNEQLTSIIAEMRDNRYPMIVSCLWNSGLRINELLALTVDDLDFDNEIIYVNKTLIETKDEHGKWLIKCQDSPKTQLSFRVVPMLGTMKNDLLKALEISNPCSDKLVFCTQTGKYVSSRNVTRSFESAKKRVGITGNNLGLHAIRHSTIIMLIEQNALLKGKADTASIDISKIMGHEINIMAYTYDNEQIERAKRIKEDYDQARMLKALNSEPDASKELNEKQYILDAIDMVYSLCDDGTIDSKYKTEAITFMVHKIKERIHYINIQLKKDLRDELMEYDPSDNTDQVFDKYEKLKANLILQIGHFDETEFNEYIKITTI